MRFHEGDIGMDLENRPHPLPHFNVLVESRTFNLGKARYVNTIVDL